MIACEVYVFIVALRMIPRITYTILTFFAELAALYLERGDGGTEARIAGKEACAFNRDISSGIEVL